MLGHTTYNLTFRWHPGFEDPAGSKVFLVSANYTTGRDIARFFKDALKRSARW
jgi:hypothetical protein